MTTFDDLLNDNDGLCRAFSAIESSLTEKQRDHLRKLFLSPDGEPAERQVKNNVVKSHTRFSCSKIGAHLTRHFDGVGARDSMMWIGFIPPQPDGHERWVLRPQIRETLRRLNWFGSGPVQSNRTSPQPADVVHAQQADFASRAKRFALVKVRTEQAAFRSAVFEACKGFCLISGSPVPEVLEAAHLTGC